MAILSPAALLELIKQRLPALGSGTRDAPVSQRTLQSTIAWSYDLLSEDDRRRVAGVPVEPVAVALQQFGASHHADNRRQVQRLPLRLVDTRRCGNGVVLLNYAPRSA